MATSEIVSSVVGQLASSLEPDIIQFLQPWDRILIQNANNAETGIIVTVDGTPVSLENEAIAVQHGDKLEVAALLLSGRETNTGDPIYHEIQILGEENTLYSVIGLARQVS